MHVVQAAAGVHVRVMLHVYTYAKLICLVSCMHRLVSGLVHAWAVRKLLECWFSHHGSMQPLAALLAAAGVPVPSLNAIAI